ncbi:MarR family transcriptional regulator [Dactylosporangium sp. NPDC049140]|uniref:MarR family transcriptional regulator n=1 Tax=Dactylosporangium sp. NPDC049140 TaxID=3155647 RepID=UPI0033E3EDEA
MPGARLTREDRERIAAGLTDGLDYAEIARRLGRPTSTVSREVARNLRTGGYRAEQAHQSTLRRRGRLPAAPERPRDGDFEQRFASLMVETGLPRMAARVLLAIVTTDAGALTAAELVQRLHVSPASVSKSVAYLESLDIVRRERAEGRRERYVIDDDVWLRTWMTSAQAHAKWGAAAREGAALHGADSPAGMRLERMGRFFDSLSQDMSADYDPAVADDMLTVIAALVHAGGPCAPDALAGALGWPDARVAAALSLAAERPDFADPVTPKPLPDGRYLAVANEQRLASRSVSK